MVKLRLFDIYYEFRGNIQQFDCVLYLLFLLDPF